ncbi:hypothetical protein [Nonomuraea wenchangensis]|uniref:hypothetical protein n=1 Tax=Nonomuraea wenchangensis TaxID=568860 RepID=UPI00378958B7
MTAAVRTASRDHLEDTMLRTFKATAVAALCCTVVGVGIAGAPAASAAEWDPFASTELENWTPSPPPPARRRSRSPAGR